MISPPLILSIVLGALLSYLIGSINFALVISKLFFRKDIREYGSGNAGMTNMLRTFGKLPALFTLLGDFGKGILAIALSRILFHVIGGVGVFAVGDAIAGLCALLGHVFPVYYHFKGGKGILVSAGIILMIDPLVCGIIFAVFLIFFAFSRIISLGSIAAAISYPAATLVMSIVRGFDSITIAIHTILALLMCLLIVYMHRANVKRLLAHEEPKIGQKSKGSK